MSCIGTTSLYIFLSPLMDFISNSHAFIPCVCAWSAITDSFGVTNEAVSLSVNPMIETSSGMHSPIDFIHLQPVKWVNDWPAK